MRKKLFLTFILFTVTFVSAYAYNDVTKFMGIPVDGSEATITHKLKYKGFKYNYRTKLLTGEFCGRYATVQIITNNERKVWRVKVIYEFGLNDQLTKSFFNDLCTQFDENPEYTPTSGQTIQIPKDENIAYEILDHGKTYLSEYYQNPEDITVVNKQLRKYLIEKYPELNQHPTEEMKAYITLDAIEYLYNLYLKKSVWFEIQKNISGYFIVLYFDNGYNYTEE